MRAAVALTTLGLALATLAPSHAGTGRLLDTRALLLDGPYPLAGHHELHAHVEHRSVYFLKFGELERADHDAWPYYERWGWDARWIYHLEDRLSEHRAYRFEGDRRWLPRHARVGDDFIVDTTKVVYARSADHRWDEVSRRPWRYRIHIEAAERNVTLSDGRTVPVVLQWIYDPRLGERPRPDGSLPGEYERYFAGDGWFGWESWRTPAAGVPDERTRRHIFDRGEAGRPLQPEPGVTPPAWWTEQRWPPAVTIRDWHPKAGTAPLTVSVEWVEEPGSLAIDAVRLEYRALGTARWEVGDREQGAGQHGTASVTLPGGTYELRVVAENAAGEHHTARQRLVRVTPGS
jgi:hypothetical protein